jgi:hypothetical protein
MTKVSTGFYYYSFTIPETWDEDFYTALYTGTLNGVAFKQEETFKVVKEETITGATLPSDAYCTLGDIQTELRGVSFSEFPDADDIMTDEIAHAERQINEATGRYFKEMTETTYLDGQGLRTLQLPHNPVTSISVCKIRVTPSSVWANFTSIAYINCTDYSGVLLTTPSTESIIESAELYCDVRSGLLIIPEGVLTVEGAGIPYWNYTFPDYPNCVQLTYTFGYSATTRPERVRELCAKMVAMKMLLLKGDYIGGGATGTNVDGFGLGFGGIPYAGRLETLKRDIDQLTARLTLPQVLT